MYIILIGMMGSGKSAVGRRAARRLGVSYVDLDTMLERAFRLTIADVFRRYGERSFRQKEEELMLRLAGEERRAVVSLGGGSVLSERGMLALKEVGKVVYLRGSVDTLYRQATRRIYKRPLLMRASDPRQVLGDLLERREHLYMKYADEVIDIDSASVEELVAKVLEGPGVWLNEQV